MRKPILRWCLGLLGAVLLALALLLYTPPGLRFVGSLAAPLTDGQVRVDDLGGFFPGRLHAARIEVGDQKGVWLRIDQAAISWSALALISNHIDIQSLSAARIAVLRRPLPSTSSGGATPRIDIGQLAMPNIVLDAPVIGHAVTLKVQGSLHYASIHQAQADLLVARTDNSDRYRIAGGIADDVIQGSAAITEGTDGMLGKLLNLPGLGAVNMQAQAGGDANANRLDFQLAAGPLRADGHGTISLAAQHVDLDTNLSAPAMTLRPGMGWQALSSEAHIHGRFNAPRVNAHLVLQGGHASGVAAQVLTVDAAGDEGRVTLTGSGEKIILPGSHPDLIAGAPLQFTADAALKEPTRPIHFTVTHPLARLEGTAKTQGTLAANATLTLPALGPLAALAGTPMGGDATFTMAATQNEARTDVTLDGHLRTQGDSLPARLLGQATLHLTATAQGSDLTASHVQLDGAGVGADVTGSLRHAQLDYRLALNLKDLSRLSKTVQGSLALNGAVTGALDNASLAASGNATLASQGFPRQRVTLAIKADGLPSVRGGSLSVDGRLNNTPLSVQALLSGSTARQAKLTARWRSLNANAAIAIGANSALSGKVQLAVRTLADLAPFTGQSLAGSADINVSLRPQGSRTDATLTTDLTKLQSSAVSLDTASLHGGIADILGKPRMNLALNAHGIAAQDWHGDADGKVQGPTSALETAWTIDLTDPQNTPLKLRAAATADLDHQQVTLNMLTGTWHAVTLALDAPATLHFANGLALNNLSAHIGKGRITANGALSPKLALTASASDITLADFRAFMPQIGAQGTLSADANVQGTLTAPTGHVAVHGRDLRTAFSPPGTVTTIDVTAQLAGDHAVIDARAEAGKNAHLTLSGTAPLQAQGAMALRGDGKVDLALMDAFMAADGRRLRGTLTLNGTVAGTPAAPRITGHVDLAGGEFQDYAQSVRLHDITASIVSDGNHINLTQATAHAGPGTVTITGSVDLAAPDMPITLQLEARNARPVASDLITASLSGNTTLSGHVKGAMRMAGKLQVTGGEINLPDNFPPEIAVLNVRRRGQPPPPPPPRQVPVQLDLTIRTTGPIFVRGHGMDAEMGGTLQITGTSGAPAISGGLRMNRGTYSVAGQTLNFTSGRVRFDGTSVRGRLDPSLDFQAQTISGGVTATLSVTGYASAPKIALSSSPQLPQDEIIAHLLFQQSARQLSPLQLASIAQAAAAMGGVGGGFNPLGTVRRTLGLDRLSIGSTQGGASGTESQTTVEAGRYVARNVYVGVKQNLSGGTQTQVQVDITRRLKAQATLSTGTTTTTAQGNALQDNGSSVGLSYQFNY